MVQVTELGYIGIGVKELETWKHFASDIIGWQIIDDHCKGGLCIG